MLGYFVTVTDRKRAEFLKLQYNYYLLSIQIKKFEILDIQRLLYTF